MFFFLFQERQKGLVLEHMERSWGEKLLNSKGKTRGRCSKLIELVMGQSRDGEGSHFMASIFYGK